MGRYSGGGMAILKVLGLIQVTLLVVLFLVVVAFIFYQDYIMRIQAQQNKKIESLLLRFNNTTSSERQWLKRHLEWVLSIFYDLEQNEKLNVHETCGLILENLFLDSLSKNVYAKDWHLRHFAALILQLKTKYLPETEKDSESLQVLLMDDTPLVVINAAIAVCYQPTQTLIDTLINSFAQERRSQYDLLRLILKYGSLQIIPFIVHRLNHEANVQIKSLCYRMLTDLPKVELEVPSLKQDILGENIDLSLAAIAYIAYSEYQGYEKLLLNSLTHKVWQVRVRAAKFIGRTHKAKLAKYLEPLLIDKVWWVRFRAAEALIDLGEPGMEILSRQTDPYAKEMAMQQIRLLQQRMGK